MLKTENSQEEESHYAAKWNILFERNQSHWMVVDSAEGVHVYACYACRDLFSSKTSFLDHINRISIGLEYYCPECSKRFNFYNPCTLLLHARNHFQSTIGTINLDNMELFPLPLGLIGFPPHPDVPTVFEDTKEEMAMDYINTNFYNPMGTQKGSQCVKLVATFLLFFNRNADRKTTMILKQVCTNLPKCVFVITKNGMKLNKANPTVLQNTANCNAINNAINVYNNKFLLLDNNENNVQNENKVISYRISNTKVNNLTDVKENLESIPKCPECDMAMRHAHFQQGSMPLTTDLRCEVCDFISPGICSFKAHRRLHTLTPPLVCPECGLTFNQSMDLLEHQTKSCYHFSKEVRMRCSKRNCSKVFTSHSYYKQHFILHVEFIIGCKECNIFYLSKEEFKHHVMRHHKDKDITPHINYRCTDDCMGRNLTTETYTEHIDWHCNPNKPYNQVYVYTCRYCRNYFRTPTTFAVHVMRCYRRNYTLSDLLSMKKPPTMTYCTNCGFVVLFLISVLSCPKCGDSESWFLHNPIYKGLKQYQCSLCNCYVPHNTEHKCKFENPIVVLNNLGDISDTIILIEQNDSKSPNAKSPDKMVEKRKRKSTSPSHQNSKKKSVRNSIDDGEILLDIPKPFNGTYSCKMCDFTTAQREDFHDHLLTHRDGAIYQCMECGESFVVKPSFEKHLIYFHQITDVDKYIAENNCCDQDMENLLQNGLESIQSDEDLKENQCKVCRQKFGDEFELKKHFRVHGMAFILTESRAKS